MTVIAAAVPARVLEQDAGGHALELGLRHRRPLDEGDPVGRQVVVEQGRVLARERAQPVEVEVGDLGRAAPSTWPIVKVGLVTGPSTPSARHAPRTNVVFPLPSSPLTRTTSPGVRRPRQLRSGASVSSGPYVCLTSWGIRYAFKRP